MEENMKISEAIQKFKNEHSDIPGFEILSAKVIDVTETVTFSSNSTEIPSVMHMDLLNLDVENTIEEPSSGEVVVSVIYRKDMVEYAVLTGGLSEDGHGFTETSYDWVTIQAIDIAEFMGGLFSQHVLNYSAVMSDVEYISSPEMSRVKDFYVEGVDFESLYDLFVENACSAYYGNLVDTIEQRTDRPTRMMIVTEETDDEYVVIDDESGSRERIDRNQVVEHDYASDFRLDPGRQRPVDNLRCIKYIFYSQYLSETLRNGNPDVPSYNFRTFLEEQVSVIEDPFFPPEKALSLLDKSQRSNSCDEKIGNILHKHASINPLTEGHLKNHIQEKYPLRTEFVYPHSSDSDADLAGELRELLEG